MIATIARESKTAPQCHRRPDTARAEKKNKALGAAGGARIPKPKTSPSSQGRTRGGHAMETLVDLPRPPGDGDRRGHWCWHRGCGDAAGGVFNEISDSERAEGAVRSCLHSALPLVAPGCARSALIWGWSRAQRPSPGTERNGTDRALPPLPPARHSHSSALELFSGANQMSKQAAPEIWRAFKQETCTAETRERERLPELRDWDHFGGIGITLGDLG